MKEIHVRKEVAYRAKESGKPGEGRKAALQPHPVQFCEFCQRQVWDHVLTIPIMCTVFHFQCNFLPQSAVEVQFPGYRAFVLPTHNQVSWGTWLLVSHMSECAPDITNSWWDLKWQYNIYLVVMQTKVKARKHVIAKSEFVLWEFGNSFSR